MMELVSQAMRDASKEDAVLLYSPGTDPFLEDLTRNADRVFYFGGAKSYDEAYCESLFAGAKEPDNPGGFLVVKWPRRC